MARGFNTTLGVDANDKIVSALTAHSTLRTWACLMNVHLDGGSSAGRIFDKLVSTSTELLVCTRTSMNFQRASSGTTGTWTWTSPSADTWHSAIVTYDAGALSNIPILYLDGVAQSTTGATQPTGTLNTSAEAYCFGNRASDNLRVFDGQLAEIAIWDRILAADEAASLGSMTDSLAVLGLLNGLVEYLPCVRAAVSYKLANPTITGTLVQPHSRVRGRVSSVAIGIGGVAPAGAIKARRQPDELGTRIGTRQAVEA